MKYKYICIYLYIYIYIYMRFPFCSDAQGVLPKFGRQRDRN
jgi:hypothetical protein